MSEHQHEDWQIEDGYCKACGISVPEPDDREALAKAINAWAQRALTPEEARTENTESLARFLAAAGFRRHPEPVKPSREDALKRAYRDRQTPVSEDDAWAFGEGARAGIDAVLALWPGRSVAEVKAEAWDEGRAAGVEDVDTSGYGGVSHTPNPYRIERGES